MQRSTGLQVRVHAGVRATESVRTKKVVDSPAQQRHQCVVHSGRRIEPVGEQAQVAQEGVGGDGHPESAVHGLCVGLVDRGGG